MAKRIKSIALAIVFVSVFAINASALIDNKMEVSVARNGIITEYTTEAKNIYSFFKELEIELTPVEMLMVQDTDEDGKAFLTDAKLSNPIVDQMYIVLHKVKRVNFEIDGEKSQIKTLKKTVGDVLESFPLLTENNFELVSAALTDTIYDEITLKFHSIRYEARVAQTEVPFQTEEQYTDELIIGETRVSQEGKNGLLETTYRDKYVSHERVESVEINIEMIEPPTTHIIEIGTKEPEPPKKMIAGYEYKEVFSMHATAYTAKPGAKTASGRVADVGIVAVDTKVIPFGTKMYIEGYGYAIAGDTGGSIKGYDVDLFYKTRSECIQFGVQTVTVYILAD